MANKKIGNGTTGMSLKAQIKEAKRQGWEEAYHYVNLRWHQGVKFEKVLDELLKKAKVIERLKIRAEKRITSLFWHCTSCSVEVLKEERCKHCGKSKREKR